ncbi:ArnT family glycosyltransferase [Tenacibaculum sp. M341]|uniref:ArnT family glycosyltransferase n=1 Tax=Tenacibaculum sp. M341 TaxID=2530339 RepID=UPI0010529C10|nr:glycosyltransferase family 39 protein [Tenacibaculum sp. M341]TCI91015.1 glycosyltransferase family 39 protein [Tenacibaculum sp. M341]
MKKITPFSAVIILIIIVTIIGLPLTLMPPDAALYASISKEMYLNNDFINLYSLGKDWLDKPHLPFWLTAISFKIFGVSNFSYKLPGVLIFFFGVWITYKFAKEAYDKKTAILASIILSTSLHSVISNFDVRAEPFLTGFIVAGLYYFFKYIQSKKISYIILGSFFCGLAVMTKGIFALIPIVAGIGGHFIVKRKWKEIANPMWLLSIVLIFIFIIPELYSLYQQFDLHPEKTVFGKTNVSGIRFFLWDSQFGRFFNTGPIKGNGDIFFFIHTILWAFLPWGIIFYLATFLKIKRNIKKVKKEEEFYTLFATLATVGIFSLSKFQLAHYTNIVFPFMSIITADFIIRLNNEYLKFHKAYKIILWFVIALSIIVVPVISLIMVPDFNWLILVVLILVLLSIRLVIKSDFDTIKKLFYYAAISFSFLYAFMLTHFYPTLFNYQGGVNAAKYANVNFKNEPIHFLSNAHKFETEFYLEKPVIRVDKNELLNFSGKLFYVNENDISYLKKHHIDFSIVKDFDFYRVTKLKGSFVNKNTRDKTLRKVFLVKLI